MGHQEPSVAIPATESASMPISSHKTKSSERIRVIEPGTTSLTDLVKELWRSRELTYFLIWRDIRVRYKQTALGVFWAILQPVISMIVMSFVFGNIGNLKAHTSGTPYPVFLYSALLPWTFFAGAFSSTSGSVVGNAALITKIRFPRIALPITATISEAVDFALALVVLLGLMVWYHVPITPRLLFIPLLLIGMGSIAIGIGSVCASLNVKYRDVRFVIPFVAQIWMYLTPVIYPERMVPPRFQWVLFANPMNGWINAFRAVFLGYPLNGTQLGVSIVASIVILLGGVYYFRLTERGFAEII